MSGFNVETYQISKKKNNASNETNYDDISNRVTTLENSLMSINSTFFCDFSEDNYIDEYKSTVITTYNGIIPRQLVNNIYINFRLNDDYVDYDKSTNIAWSDKSFIQFDRDITTEGQLYLFPVKVNNAMGFKLDSDYTTPALVSGYEENELIDGSLWSISGVDNFNRLWIFTMSGYKTNDQTSKINLTIYNDDMTIYKTKEFNNFLYVDTTNRVPRPESCCMKFNDENMCFFGCVVGGTYANVNEYVMYFVTDGDTAKKIYSNVYYSYYSENTYSILPPRIYIDNDIVFFSGNTKSSYYSFIQTIDIIVNFKAIDDYKIIYSKYQVNEISSWVTQTFSQYHTNIFKANNELYYISPKYDWNVGRVGAITLSMMSLFKHVISDNREKIAFTEVPLTYNSDSAVYYSKNSLNGMYVYNNKLYGFYNDTGKNLVIRKFNIILSDTTAKLVFDKSVTITLKTTTCYDNAAAIAGAQYLYKNGLFHIFYVTRKFDNDYTQCLKYIAIDVGLNVSQEETILFETSSNKLYFNIIELSDELMAICNYNEANNYTTDDTKSKSKLIRIKRISSRIKFYYLDNVKRIWTNINSGDEVNFESPVSEITVRAIMESDTYNCSPVINNITLEVWNNENGVSRQSEYYSNRIEDIQSNGRGILTADYEDNDGIIEWFISYDGGENYTPVKLNDEFNFSHIESPDFRVKAILSVTDNAKKLPIIHNYTIKTNYLVLHSDLEELQINLMKTNFKIDTYSNAAKNGLLKMTVDTLSNEDFIDGKNSKYVYYSSYGYAGGNYLQTKPEEVNKKVQTILLTTDEILENDDDHILYYASADGGKTFKEIKPDAKTQLKNTNKSKDSIVMKAVFYGEAKLNAWGWAWD